MDVTTTIRMLSTRVQKLEDEARTRGDGTVAAMYANAAQLFMLANGFIDRAVAMKPSVKSGLITNPSPFRVETKTSTVAKLLARTPQAWDDPWWNLDNVIDAFKNMLRDQAATPPPPSPKFSGRGIVICAGGWKYFPSLYVTVKMIRKVGCELPIQVWYLGDRGEFDPAMGDLLKGQAVEWIDADKAWRATPAMQIRQPGFTHGWMLKPFSAAFSPFAEVLCFDADSYPCYDPQRLLDHPEFVRTGALFTADINTFPVAKWRHFGFMNEECPAFESGQYLIDKSRNWDAIYLTCWINAFHDYVYKHIHGDKDTYLLAWTALGREFAQPAPVCDYHTHSIIQPDFDGNAFTVHRTQDKFRINVAPSGERVINKYYGLMNWPEPTLVRQIPHEVTAFKFFKELQAKLKKMGTPEVPLPSLTEEAPHAQAG